MEKIKEFFKDKKNIGIVGGIVAAIVVIVIIVLCFAFKSNEGKINSTLKDMGSSFYEDFYWKQVGKDDEARKEFLEKFKDNGIKVNLDNLLRYDEKNSEKEKIMVNSKTKKACDKSNTKVTIYPKDPYGQKDYKIEVTLDCGFKK